tara:strand:+ start:1835 stop:2959 length:1125 start_codon:yes stop_codon:yes gene_type:complete
MKKFSYAILAITILFCSNDPETSVNTIENDITTTTQETAINDSSKQISPDETSVDEDIIEKYVYDSEKMSPFTGLEISSELWLKRPRRVLAFKIDNNLKARPQSGLQEADTVMEILVEGGMTRFLAFFMDNQSSYVGPIRSARPTDPTLVRPYGGILVVSGATAGLIPEIRELGVPVLEERPSPTMFRIEDRNKPHNLYADTELVREYVDEKGFYFNQSVQPLYEFGNDQTAWLTGANRITIKYSDFTTVIWKKDQDKYSRFIVDGYDSSNEAVAHNFLTRDGYSEILQVPTVVLIQGALYNDESTTLPSVLTVGIGPLTIFHDGKFVEGTWRRNDIADPFVFFDKDQNKIEVPPSKQWIHILPSTAEITWSDK